MYYKAHVIPINHSLKGRCVNKIKGNIRFLPVKKKFTSSKVENLLPKDKHSAVAGTEFFPSYYHHFLFFKMELIIPLYECLKAKATNLELYHTFCFAKHLLIN